MAHRTLSGAPFASSHCSNDYNLVGGYKYHPTDHLNVWEPKQHSKSYSWHIQALPTTSIHWSILYTRFRPLQPSQVPQKRDQAKESYSCEFSTSALWDSLRESVCYILWSFERGVLTPIHCKASKSPLSLWLALRRLRSLVEKEEELVGLGDRWREGKGWKRPVLSGLLNGDQGLGELNLGKTNNPCHLCLLLVICLSSPSLSSLALFLLILLCVASC